MIRRIKHTLNNIKDLQLEDKIKDVLNMVKRNADKARDKQRLIMFLKQGLHNCWKVTEC